MIESFTTIFLSIILEAIPFVMIGAFISSIIQLFVSEQTIARIIPKNRFVGLLTASLMGLIFPVCECAIVPIMRRLVKKGVPLHIAVTFMLAVPIVNPVVLASTFYAFNGSIYMVFLRGWLGLCGAILIGHIIGVMQGKKSPLKEEKIVFNVINGCGHGDDHEHHEHSSCCDHDHSIVADNSLISRAKSVLQHTSMELYDVGKFLIMGAFLSSIMQTYVSRSYLLTIGQGQVSSVLVMLTLAFVLSLCSEADAFIARTFLGQFTTGSIVGFLILGPMIDIKNVMMLSGSFNAKFVIRLVGLVFIVCFALSMLVNFIL